MGFSLRIADPVTDKETILELWQKNLTIQDQEKRFQWLYEDNPEGPMLTVLAFDDKDGQVVGAGSLYPTHLMVGEKCHSVSIAADFMIDQKHRVFGPAIKIQRMLASFAGERAGSFLLAYPNKAGVGVFKRVGYNFLSPTRRFVKPLRTRSFIEKLSFNRYVPPGLLAFFLDKALLLNDLVNKTMKCRNLESGFTEDAFIAQMTVADRLRTTLIGADQTANYKRWRYFGFNDCNKAFYLKHAGADQPIAMLVYSQKNNNVRILDIQSTSQQNLSNILTLFSLEMRQRGIDLLEVQVLVPGTVVTTLKSNRFIEREDERSVHLCFGEGVSQKLKDVLLEPSSWLAFEADLDI